MTRMLMCVTVSVVVEVVCSGTRRGMEMNQYNVEHSGGGLIVGEGGGP